MFNKQRIFFFITLLSSFSLMADETANKATITNSENNLRLFGTLFIPPPCVIQNNDMIDVNFGHQLGTSRIDGINYTKTVNYTLQCEENAKGWALGLSIIGSASQFDAAALQTNITDLAVHLTIDSEPFILNKRFVITSDKPPIILAVPVKKSGSTLTKGAFEATATLLAEYQ